MTWGSVWTLLPDEFFPLIIGGIGLVLMLGLLSGRTVIGLLVLLVLMQVLSPVMAILLGAMPLWLLVLGLAVFLLVTIRNLATPVVGRRATDSLMTTLVVGAVRVVCAVVFLPFRLLGWLFGFSGGGKA